MKLRATLALGAIIAGASLPAVAATLPAAATTATTPTAAVSIAPADFGDAHSGQALRLFVTIDDQVGAGIEAGSATVTVDRTPSPSRASLSRWFAGTTKLSTANAKLTRVDTPAIAPGVSRLIPVTIPASALHLRAQGVYPIAVSVSVDGSTVGTARTAIAWRASGAAPVPLALAAPITVPASEGTFIDSKTLAAYTSPDGILSTELADLQNTQVAIGIDPRILASIQVLGKSAPQSAIDWLEQLRGLSNETFPLDWADADLTAPLQAGAATVPRSPPLDFAIQPSQFAPLTTSTPTPAPTSNPDDPPLPTSDSLTQWDYTLPQLSWPAENSVVKADLPKLQASGYASAIVSSENVKWSSNHASLGSSAKASGLALSVSDAELSGYLRDAAKATTRAAWTSAMAELTTSLDLASIESGSSPRIMLATFGRDWANSEADFGRTVQGVYSRSWVTSATLTSVTTATPSTVRIVDKPQLESRIDQVHRMLVEETRVGRFSEITAPDQETLTSTRRLLLLSLLSDSWLQDPTGWSSVATGYVTSSQKILNSVMPVKSNPVLFLGSQVSFPVTVSNTLAQTVTVYVAVRPKTPLLSVDKGHEFEKVVLPANSQHRAEIPVQSVANGQVAVRVTLYSASGKKIGKTTIIQVNVQAGWETVGTLAFGALIVAIFAFGIIRNIRQRRKARLVAAGGGEEPSA